MLLCSLVSVEGSRPSATRCERFSIPRGVIAFGYTLPRGMDLLEVGWSRLIRSRRNEVVRYPRNEMDVVKRRFRFSYSTYACIDRSIVRSFIIRVAASNLLVRSRFDESRCRLRNFADSAQLWNAQAQWKINPKLTRFHAVQCIIGGDDEGGTSVTPWSEDLRGGRWRDLESWGGISGIRGWNELEELSGG